MLFVKYLCCGAFFLLYFNTALFSQTYHLSGCVLDQSGEPIIDAYCRDKKSNTWTITNEDGYYSLKLPQPNATLLFSHIGYLADTLTLSVQSDTTININLSARNIDEVVVLGSEIPLHQQTLSGKISLSTKTIENMPTFIGEPDIIRAATTLPGIAGNNKGFSAMFVRGGGRGNNLFLLDDAPVYSTNHLFGLLSVFNTDIVKNVDVYKGGFPARYGGFTASILDIKTKRGNTEKIKGKFNIGVLKSKIMIEGPLFNKKTSYVLAARASYLDLLTWMLTKRYKNAKEDASGLSYRFYDLNAKINRTLRKSDKLFFNFYYGKDNLFSFERSVFSATKNHSTDKLYQNNLSATLGYSAVLSPSLLLKTTLVYTSYINGYSSFAETDQMGIAEKKREKSINAVQDGSLNIQFDYTLGQRHYLKAGCKLGYVSLKPGEFSYFEDVEGIVTDTLHGVNFNQSSKELSLFVEDEFRISKRFNINAGIRYSNIYSDTTFKYIEPRISIRAMLTDNLSIKSSYTQTRQYNHILSNNYQGVSGELWIISRNNVLPEQAEQISAGLFGIIPYTKTEYSIEGYYKTQYNLLYSNYTEPDVSLFYEWDQNISDNGKGYNYGLELMLKTKRKKFSTSMSYTLSWNYLKFSSLNNGNKFNSPQNRLHDLNLSAQIKLKKQRFMSLNFVFNTGTPFSIPVAYVKQNTIHYGYYAYGELNSNRLPPYHRLDVSYKKNKLTKRGRKAWWSFDIYNVYARKNPIYLYIENDKIKTKSLHSIIPSINWGMNF